MFRAWCQLTKPWKIHWQNIFKNTSKLSAFMPSRTKYTFYVSKNSKLGRLESIKIKKGQRRQLLNNHQNQENHNNKYNNSFWTIFKKPQKAEIRAKHNLMNNSSKDIQ